MRTFILSIALVLSLSTLAVAQAPAGVAAGAPALGPLTLTPAIVSCTDLPTVSTLPSTDLLVLGLHNGDRRFNAARGDIVVLSRGTPQGLSIGQQYIARRLMKPVNHAPVTPANPAAVVTSGWLTVVSADQQFALARIDQSCLAIEAGDYLEPFVEPALPTTLAGAGRTDFSTLGRVLFGVFRRSSFGAGDVLSIDRGSRAGMTTGTRVAFYRDRRNSTPLVELGDGIVVDVSAETAKVVVERASQDIRTGDYYGVRSKP
jgi:hypothetical protein